MAEPQYDTLQLVGVHTPDYSTETDAGGNKYQQELPGTYEVGVLIGDTFMALATFKAGNMIDSVRQLQGKQGSAPVSQTQPQPEQAPSGEAPSGESEASQTQPQG